MTCVGPRHDPGRPGGRRAPGQLCCARAGVEALHDRFAELSRIGIGISYKRGHRYLTVMVDHDSGRLVWAAPGRDKATLELFRDALGEDRCAQITHVSADGADWISAVVAEKCLNAVRCADPFT